MRKVKLRRTSPHFLCLFRPLFTINSPGIEVGIGKFLPHASQIIKFTTILLVQVVRGGFELLECLRIFCHLVREPQPGAGFNETVIGVRMVLLQCDGFFKGLFCLFKLLRLKPRLSQQMKGLR